MVGEVSTETPASVSVLGTPELRQLPGLDLDDRLRIIPGFSLFRRSSGVVANPTTQGVSLRGLGSSGASRTLVLWDGIPVNDPFGGWVYWTRFSPDDLERVEVSRGASTSLFGDKALGGAIALFSRPAERVRLHGFYEGGNRNTHSVGAGFALPLPGRWAISGDSRAMTTDGYFIVASDRRGKADEQAGVRFVTGDVRIDWTGVNDRLFLKADLLAEQRNNGTVVTRNSTSLGTVAGHYEHGSSNNTLSLLGYHTRGEYRASFSSISADRNTERLTSIQSVPNEATGAAGMFRHSRSTFSALVGADVNRVEGYSVDTFFPGGPRTGGGTQLQHGVFTQWNIHLIHVDLFAGVRHQVTGQDRNFFSPSAGLASSKGPFRFRGSVYRSYRAPTLNELFREFRAGNSVTLANAALRPETLFGAEFGADWTGESTRIGVTAFRHSLDDLITNVTLSTTPALVTRQRQNAVAALTRGVEVEMRRRWRAFRAEANYLFADSRYQTGERVPQVPRHQGSFQLSWQHKSTFVAAGIRSYSLQFEDDRNQICPGKTIGGVAYQCFLLPGFATVQLAVRQHLHGPLSLNLAIENLLNHSYLVGFTPTPNIGPPLLWRGGIRWER